MDRNDRAQIAAHIESKYDALENKAMHGMSRDVERRFCKLLEALGGGPADGRGTLGAEALLCDERTFERGASLWYGQAAPETETERVALERWRPRADP